jgi:hypothetical protein
MVLGRNWNFSRQDLAELLNRLDGHDHSPPLSLAA